MPRKVSTILGASVVLLVAGGVAEAHTLGISSGEYRLSERTVHARLAFAIPDAMVLVPALDADGDRRVSALEASRAKEAVARALEAGLRIEGDGAPCTPTVTDAAPTEGDGFLLEADYTCPESPREVTLVATFTAGLGEAHRHVARTVGASTADTLLTSASHRATFRAAEGPAAAPKSRAEGPNRAVFVVGALLAIVGALLLLAQKKAPPSPPERRPPEV